MRETFLMMLLMSILSSISTKCSSGCISCPDKVTCKACDPTLLYKLQAGSCVKVVAENCLLIDSQGFCLMCEEDHYLNKANNSCVKFTDESRVANCVFQTS